uniref:Uncharacterized protein n=1 Tax=Anguilla anguilla TaxID=7936 RepID=A0A0E9XKR2_ANGAN
MVKEHILSFYLRAFIYKTKEGNPIHSLHVHSVLHRWGTSRYFSVVLQRASQCYVFKEKQ